MIRRAEKQDVAAIIPLLLVILRDMELPFLAKYGEETITAILTEAYLEPSFRYSYQRGIVCVEEGEVVGVAYGYPAAAEKLIDLPLAQIFPQFGIAAGDKMFTESEAFADEWYLDSLSVAEGQQGQGIGTKLLAALPEYVRAEGSQRIGLSCDLGNPAAKKLYLRQGFQVVGTAQISGHDYEHLQKELAV